jgi:hypothetical protein
VKFGRRPSVSMACAPEGEHSAWGIAHSMMEEWEMGREGERGDWERQRVGDLSSHCKLRRTGGERGREDSGFQIPETRYRCGE